MARQTRRKSQTGIYHVMARGINRQEIFKDDQDRARYLEILQRVKQDKGIEILGYCLMENHVHLLLKEGKEGLAAAMSSIGTSYARWYNWKYNRIGHVFQDRYKSECVEDEAYLLTVIRYIHQNPVKANLVQKPESWSWSSCGAYYGTKEFLPGLTEKSMILGIFAENREEAASRFREYMEEAHDDNCLDYEEIARKTDEEVQKEIVRLLGGISLEGFHRLSQEERHKILCAVKAIEGTTYRQIAGILGISVSTIFKAVNE